MSKERLEEIRDQLEESNSYDDNSNGYWYNAIKWLIEQAERVQELEKDSNRYRKSIEQVDGDRHKVRSENKRYRKFFQDIMELQLYINYTEEELYLEMLKIVDDFLLEGDPHESS